MCITVTNFVVNLELLIRFDPCWSLLPFDPQHNNAIVINYYMISSDWFILWGCFQCSKCFYRWIQFILVRPLGTMCNFFFSFSHISWFLLLRKAIFNFLMTNYFAFCDLRKEKSIERESFSNSQGIRLGAYINARTKDFHKVYSYLITGSAVGEHQPFSITPAVLP